MISINGMSTYFDKTAAKAGVGETMWRLSGKGGVKTLRFLGKHPIGTAGALAASALITGFANRIHNLYNITSEMRKRKTMKKDIVPTLREIAANTKAATPAAKPNVRKLIIPPLS